jgi:hypothetical protein
MSAEMTSRSMPSRGTKYSFWRAAAFRLFLDIVDGGVMICEDDRAEDEESESKDRWTRRSRSGEGTRDDDSETDSEARRRYEEEKRGEKNGVVGNSSGDVKGRKEEFWVGNASVC